MPKTQGQYKGKDIFAGNDAYITQQMQAIDAASVPAPTQPKPISASAAPTQAMQVQQFTPTPPPPIDPVVQQLQAQQQQAQAAIEAGNKEQGTIVQSVEALLNQQGQMGARQSQLEQEAGLPELQKNLSNINAQINQTVGQAFSEQQAAEGRLAPTFAISGDQQRIEREKAVRTFGLSAAAAAIQGNIGLAQDNIKRAIDSEFSGIESRLKYQQVLLDLNRDKLTGAQRDKADAIQQLLQERKEQVAQQKADRETIQGLALQAQQGGAPSAVISSMMNAQDFGSALSLAGDYLQPQTVASIQEYNFAVKNGYKGSYVQYQNEDANRKASIASAGVVTPGAPNSYKEWELAGKPGTYEQWLKDNNVKAPTVAQQTVSTYAARIEQANPTIDQLTSAITSMSPLKFEAQQRLPSYLQSAQFQQFDQAARNFVNAVLRRESGAVISSSEFDNAYKQYLPRPGDTTATLAEKKRNRDIVFASLRNAAGNAYQSVEELIGAQTPTTQQKGILISRNGQQGYIDSMLEFNPKTDKKL